MRAGGRYGTRDRALVHICTIDTIAPVAGDVASASIRTALIRVVCSSRVRAGSARAADVRARRALVDVGAADAVTSIPGRAGARERAGRVGAVVDVEAIVRSGGAFVDLSTRSAGARVAALAHALTADEMRRLNGAARALVVVGAAAGRAA